MIIVAGSSMIIDRKKFEESVKRWEAIVDPVVQECRASHRITAADLQVTIGPRQA